MAGSGYLYLNGLQVPPGYYVPQHDTSIVPCTQQQSAVMGMGLQNKYLPRMTLRGGGGRDGGGGWREGGGRKEDRSEEGVRERMGEHRMGVGGRRRKEGEKGEEWEGGERMGWERG